MDGGCPTDRGAMIANVGGGKHVFVDYDLAGRWQGQEPDECNIFDIPCPYCVYQATCASDQQQQRLDGCCCSAVLSRTDAIDQVTADLPMS